MVGQNDIPTAFFQRGLQLLLSFNPLELRFKLRPAQLTQHQRCVIFLVLNDNDPQRSAHTV